MMATGPEAFVQCLNKYVPYDADAVLLSFADMCAPIRDDKQPETVSETGSASYGVAMERMVRSLLSRYDPPAVGLFNVFLWTNHWHCKGECAFTQSCDPYLTELASFYHASVVSMRMALWHEAHALTRLQAQAVASPTARRGLRQSLLGGANGSSTGVARTAQRYKWWAWTIEGGRHLDLRRGDMFAAELLYYWVRAAASHERPFAVPDLSIAGHLHANGGLAGGGQRGGEASAGSCFSFDEGFDGLITPPRVLTAKGWRMVSLDDASDAEPESGAKTQIRNQPQQLKLPRHHARKLKPGYKALNRGATLHIDTRTSGQRAVSLGFLRTYSSRGVAQLSCVPPCACLAANLSAHTDARTSTTVFSSPLTVSSPREASCILELRLLTAGEQFKFIALQVA